MMRDIMNTPAMQSLTNNPEIIRSLIMSNPRMREIIDRNPELAHVLNDPELMCEMMRNTDRAMSNIESSPEGFNMLRRMYENVQEPFLNATTAGGGGTGTGAGTNPFGAVLGNQAGAQTRGVSQTNSGMRNNTTGDAGSGGIVLPELGRTGMTDPADFSQLLQNPAVAQITQSLLSNPQYMERMLGFNPQLRNILDMNPQLREMMQNPEILCQLTSPEMMQQVMSLQQQLSQLTRQQSTPAYLQLGGVFIGYEALHFFIERAQNNMGLEMLMNITPEELYAIQLSQLQEMGFIDNQENIIALRATSGNVHAAGERLLGNLGQ
ncbi:ubiquitin 1 [Striga asiatica]|uniref:Ubiquitin 1 n=1 Tax=Striga asiatica TaxID=4170 RepID=A0A5A7QXX3_STRAF|nr:ubiquitin 1 [Striga asiatica]